MSTHDHAHHGHAHASGATDNERRMAWAFMLTGGFMIAEVIGGIVSGSLALLADAGHMLADTAALGLAWIALRTARRPTDPKRTYGYHRAQILAAFVNGVALFAIVVWIFYEAVRRLLEPVEILGGLMLVVAVLGLAVNVVSFAILHAGRSDNLNVRSAALHVLGDLLGSVAAIVAAAVIVLTDWTPIDPLLSVLVGLLILRSAWHIVRRTTHILLEGAPEDIDVSDLRASVTKEVPEVQDIHHVHAWSLTPERPLMTLHATIDERADSDSVLRRIKSVLAERFGIGHATIQIEREICVDEHGAPLKGDRRRRTDSA